MCRGAAANAKQGCKQLAKQTAITTNKMKTERITNSKINITPLPTCVLKAYTGQRNDVGGGNEKEKRPREHQRIEASGSCFRPGLAIPCCDGRPTNLRSVPGPTPFHQATTMYTKRKTKLQTSSAEGTSTPRKYDRKNCEPPLDANGSFRDVAPIPKRPTVAPGALLRTAREVTHRKAVKHEL